MFVTMALTAFNAIARVSTEGSSLLNAGWPLAAVEIENASMGQFQGRAQALRCGLPGLPQPLRRQLQGVGPHPVEALAEIEQGPVTAAAHLLENGGHLLLLLPQPAVAGAA